ncbi:MAG TPA: hypothetical protein VNO50_04475 [Pyrinomonadaceae bacterium]|nr:hypothetical protein [Pyrinomonadaceae bacterium]
MTRELKGIHRTPHTTVARVVSLLLLSFIVYGTTVASAHKHSAVFGPTPQAPTAAFSEPETNSTTDLNLAGCGECLICQLHQDFSTSLIVERDSSSPPPTRLLISQASFELQQTRAATSHSGRAPPFTS